ncbi:cell wall synthesis protein Wag31 [Brevibacterium daeguense]|uniref:Cell wall synthesis protein Wag31 n=1 Tax=Brevibacterium daeguense TaxID=909936 RepID=A0ABP8EMT1_9MICO|nr:DivIVA domain-containing protein [Brevibacterium daeguense]
MALTPEDVVNKRFQHVKFRDGYDQDEVDDFLDEVVVELRRLYQENDELRQKLSACEQRVNELSQGGASRATQQSPAVDADATQAMPAAVPANEPKQDRQTSEPAQTPASPVVAPQAPTTPAASAPAPQPKREESVQPPAASGAGKSGGPNIAAGGQDATGLIQLAQRLHDEHVAEGERKRDQLVSDAEKKASQIVGDAERKRDDTLRHLESEKANLEREIDGLQNFERQYRTRLKSYLTDQLRELENSGSLAPESLGGNKLGNNSSPSI